MYNGSAYLGSLLENICQYNTDLLSHLEVLLVDDGSTDDSFIVCEKLATKYAFCRIFRKSNGGISSAREFGLKYAQGDYIAFIDQDDKLCSGYQKYVKLLEESNAQLLISNEKNSHVILQDLRIETPKNKELARFILAHEKNSFSSLLHGNLVSIWNCIFSRDIIRENEIHFKSFVAYEDDFMFLLENINAVQCLYLSSECFYEHVDNISSESHKIRYVENYYHKRRQYQSWACGCLGLAGADSTTIRNYVQLVNEETFAKALSHSARAEYPTFKKEILEVLQAPEFSVSNFLLPISRRSILRNLLYLSLKCHMYRMVYYLIRMRNKRYYC